MTMSDPYQSFKVMAFLKLNISKAVHITDKVTVGQ